MRIVSCFLVAASMSAGLFAAGELSGRRAPGFALPDRTYTKFHDLQDYRGKVVLIDIMSTNCPHCLLLGTTLEKVKAKYGDKVQILSVVLPPDNQSTVEKFINLNKITVPVAFDQGQMTMSYLKATPENSHIDVPHLFLIDKQGYIQNDWAYAEKERAVFEGPSLFPEIDKLLK